jgi:CheY-like chemotaxis protein
VDDHFENRDWLIKLLTSIGFVVRAAGDGQGAIELWREWHPRLILMDVHMPVVDGLEATRRIKAAPDGHQTLIIALTASALQDDRERGLAAGVDAFLTKPCREEDLLETMRELLGIEYEYVDSAPASDEAPVSPLALTAESLSTLPRELLEQLRRATLTGNKKQLDALIIEVRAAAPAATADALQSLADTYEYDALTRILDAAWS